MKHRRAIEVVAGVVIVGSVLLFHFATNPIPPFPDRKLNGELGRLLARETLRRVRPGVGIAVIRRDTEAFGQPGTDLLFAAFESEFLSGGGRIAVVQRIQVDPLRNLEVPPGDFFELIRKSPPGSGIVSLMGPPVLHPDQQARLEQVNPAIIAFCPGWIPRRVNLGALFESGLLAAAVIEESGTGAGTPTHYRVIEAAPTRATPAPP